MKQSWKRKAVLPGLGLMLALGAWIATPGGALQSQDRGQTESDSPSERRVRQRAGLRTGVDAQVKMQASASRLKIGERLSVRIDIRARRDVGHAPFHVSYDPHVLRFEAGEEGDFLRADGHDTAFFATPTSSGDTVVVGLSRLGRAVGVTGQGELCRLHFVAVGPGPAALSFARPSVRDGQNKILRSSFVPASVVAE